MDRKKKAEYTKRQISTALVELLQRQPIETITITNLAERAKVSRSAFYNNYKNMEGVLKEAYRQAHQEAFSLKYHDLDYINSHQFIKDIIRFFDENTELLLALMKWDLLSYVAKYNTDITNNCAKNYGDAVIRENTEYFTLFYWSRYFNICRYWIMEGKRETPEEIYQVIIYLENMSRGK